MRRGPLCRRPVNPHLRKYSTLPKFGIVVCVVHPGSFLRGGVSRHDREPGMRWTRQRRARQVRAGRVVPGEPVTARGRTALTGSFRGRDGGNVHNVAGPDAKASEPRVRQNRVVLTVVRHGQALVDAGAAPTGAAAGDFHQGEGGQKEIRLPGEHGISRPTIAQGRPGVRPHLYAAVRFFLRVHFAQRTAGAGRHPAFPVPSRSRGRRDPGKARATCAARAPRRALTQGRALREPESTSRESSNA
jgi:hypothetical protein